MLAGLPIVATRVSGVSEIVADGQTGHLVRPGDDARLAAVIGALLEQPARARHLGSAGLERARTRFSVEQMTSAMAAVYELEPLMMPAGRRRSPVQLLSDRIAGQ